VIGLDRAGIAEAVAPNGTAVTEAQHERMWRLDPAPFLCFVGASAGKKAAIRAATRALPHLGPERTLRFVELPAGQDPDDLVKSGGREAVETLLAEPEPLDQRLWRHERDSAPLTTPEARAGLRQRLVEHSQAIGDPELRRLYRDQWLGQFEREFGSVRPPFRRQQNRFDKRTGKWQPPAPPASDAARRIGRSGIDTATARALVLGFALYPEAVPAQLEQLAHLPIADRPLASLRDRIVDAALAHQALDRQKLATILATAGAAATLEQARRAGGRGFSFTRSDADPERAVHDLGVAIDALAAKEEIDAALADALKRFGAGDDEAFEDQRRLKSAQQEVMQRLASLVGTE
jgi:DNA primase